MSVHLDKLRKHYLQCAYGKERTTDLTKDTMLCILSEAIGTAFRTSFVQAKSNSGKLVGLLLPRWVTVGIPDD